jgi:hypothetical protein
MISANLAWGPYFTLLGSRLRPSSSSFESRTRLGGATYTLLLIYYIYIVTQPGCPEIIVQQAIPCAHEIIMIIIIIIIII